MLFGHLSLRQTNYYPPRYEMGVAGNILLAGTVHGIVLVSLSGQRAAAISEAKTSNE